MKTEIKWHKVTEKLPTENQLVICYSPTSLQDMLDYFEECEKERIEPNPLCMNGVCPCYYMNDGLFRLLDSQFSIVEGVTHWMPMPDAPLDDFEIN